MQKITPFLWFNDNAEEAVKFYTSIFKNSKIGKMTRYDEGSANASGRPKGSLMTASFELEGMELTALNGGPHFKFTEAISFVVNCADQSEIDYFWEKLTSGGGQEVECGWLKDRFGLSWQIIPAMLPELVQKSPRVMQALLQMKKLDIQKLKDAAEGK